MRLIDADAFCKRFNNMCETITDKQIACIVIGAIASEPTAYDIDKVVEELEKEREEILNSNDYENEIINYCLDRFDKAINFDKAIEIVKKNLKEIE